LGNGMDIRDFPQDCCKLSIVLYNLEK